VRTSSVGYLYLDLSLKSEGIAGSRQYINAALLSSSERTCADSTTSTSSATLSQIDQAGAY